MHIKAYLTHHPGFWTKPHAHGLPSESLKILSPGGFCSVLLLPWKVLGVHCVVLERFLQ